MTNAICLDLDGTICDNTHRLHLIKGEKKNYDEFFNRVGLDDPIYDVIWLVDMLLRDHHYTEFELFICSGRSENCRKETEEWLKEFTPDIYNNAKAILMRESGDYRQDYIIKEEMLKSIQGQGYNIRAVIDDRPQVIEKCWKKNGITVFKVGDWEREELNVEPGTLHMMVGPSGSGKTELAGKMFPKDIIISSDNLREQLTGDFKDMSKDTIMWDMLHKLVNIRLQHGADTVVDATNLKNHNRKELRDQQLPNGRIVYHIYNRRMKDKVITGGWRNEVQVKNKSLLEYHEQVFKSNLSAILAGDDDERVEVKDYR